MTTDNLTSGRSFKNAIVIGGSIGGLLAARALADYFENVTVLDRDVLAKHTQVRKTAPQGAHVHVLLESGKDIVENLFPGIWEELLKENLNIIDTARDFIWHHQGVWKARYTSGIKMVLTRRPYLEHCIRTRVRELPNIDFRPGVAVAELLANEDNSRVTGVKIQSSDNNSKKTEELRADLIIDASGRGSQSPKWLEDLGYSQPQEERVGINLAYTSRQYEIPESFNNNWQFLIHYPVHPTSWRSGFISTVEGANKGERNWIVSLNGYFNEHAPLDDKGFLEFAKSLTRPDLYNYIKDARPVSDLAIHKFPYSRWRHYEKLSRFPESYIILGDAVCSFNPIFGQGMSMAGKGAHLLKNLLEEQIRRSPESLDGLAKKHRKRLPKLAALPWFLTKVLDLNYKSATGKRLLGHGLLAWYVARLLELSSKNPRIYHEFNFVLHMQKGLGNILKPSVSLPVLLYGIKSFFTPLKNRANVDQLPTTPAQVSYSTK